MHRGDGRYPAAVARKPPIDLYDEWLAFERMIFPSPVWDGYR